MVKSNLVTRKTTISANIVSFCRFLRESGFNIGPTEEADALQAMTLMPFDSPDHLSSLLRAVLTKNRRDQLRFDELYDSYWRELETAVDSKVKQGEPEAAPQGQSHSTPNAPPSLQVLKDWLHGKDAQEAEELAAYSGQVVLTRKDFSLLKDDELHQVMKMIAQIARSLAARPSRRYQSTHQRRQFDVRKTIRNSMRRGGEIVELSHRKQRQHKLKLLMLCDVSKSMDLYSRFLLHFIYAFQNVYRRIESFVFSTSLHHVSEALQSGEFATSLDELARQIPDWSGGTRIGSAFHRFVQDYGGRMLDDHTIVIIVSDGWDTGDIDLLQASMKQIHERAGRVIWLNPLAGSAAYQPTVKGMQAAMPYLDIFAPFHNLESLRSLVRHLRSSNHQARRKYRRKLTEYNHQ